MYDLNLVKQLSTEQYDSCRDSALQRVIDRLGDKPTRDKFMRDYGTIFTLLDVLALVAFVAAVLVSSVHIWQFMSNIAASSYPLPLDGQPYVMRWLWFASHQWSYILLAESAVLLFTVLFSVRRNTWRRWVFLALALFSAFFVLSANLSLHWLSPLFLAMPAIFTLGIGLHVEHVLVQVLKRRSVVNEQYMQALAEYEITSRSPEDSPHFMPFFRQSLWDKSISFKQNKPFVDAPTRFRLQVVGRELLRESWAYEAFSYDPVQLDDIPFAAVDDDSDYDDSQDDGGYAHPKEPTYSINGAHNGA